MVAGFYPRTDVVTVDQELHSKRCSFIACIVQLMCRCTTERDVKTDALTVVINNLISEVESITGAGEII
jgi:vancomycin permeability regulator SanA